MYPAAELDRIVNHVQDGGTDKAAVGAYGRLRVTIVLFEHGDTPLVEDHFHEREDLSDELGQKDRFLALPNLTGLGTCEDQESVDGLVEPDGFFKHAADCLPQFVRGAPTLECQFAGGSKGRERSAQFVRGIRGEPLELCKRLLKPTQKVIEDTRAMCPSSSSSFSMTRRSLRFFAVILSARSAMSSSGLSALRAML